MPTATHARREAHQRLPLALAAATTVADVTLRTRDDWAGLESEVVVRGSNVPATVCRAVADLGLSLRDITRQGDALVVTVA
jgi:hypothetical protein